MFDFLPAFKVVTTHGVRGEMKAQPLCDGAAFLARIKRVYTSAQGAGETALQGVRAQGSMLLVRLAGVDSMDAARALVGHTFYFAKQDARLPKGRYFIDDLLGCAVTDADTGTVYGTIAEIDHPAAHDIYTVRRQDGSTALFPAVPEFLDRVDLEARAVYVRPIPGMFDQPVNGDEE
ncbi:16S rRNA processing protein RimM [Gemmiger formicilis]|uniref:ribosome maturation factor RimM n=1 Tax=Gemmiger formicilis TaxID=745368 RepID=UPI00195A3A2E|nr:ribosome maturation factor RimM [Gemmiger formicilis]MBM6715472.1 16S rRNA processing protein RimM [Gemmiger formicilis]